MQISRAATLEEFGKLKIDTTTSPITESKFDSLLEKLQIKDFSEEDKNLFQSIIKDRKITEEEYNNLSYSQSKKLNQIISRSDLSGNFIPDTFVFFEKLSMAPLISVHNISDDDIYNEAVFNTIKKLNLSQQSSLSILSEIGGLINEEEKINFENRLSANQYDLGIRYKTYMGLDMEELVLSRLTQLEKDFLETSDKEVKKDYKMIMNIYSQIQFELNKIKFKNETQVEQYTRNNKPNPLNNSEVIELYNRVLKEQENKEEKEFDKLLDILNINNISIEDKKLFRNILEDKNLSNIEMDKLSFSQMKKINQLIFREDENAKIINDTIITSNNRIKAILSTTEISDDDNFNELLFKTVKSFSEIDEINNFLSPIINIIADKFTNFDTVNQINSVEQDINKVLDTLIEEFYENCNNPKFKESKEYYENKINQYKDLKNHYNKL